MYIVPHSDCENVQAWLLTYLWSQMCLWKQDKDAGWLLLAFTIACRFSENTLLTSTACFRLDSLKVCAANQSWCIHIIPKALCLKICCKPDSISLLWCSLPTFKLVFFFMGTFRGKTAHIYVNYCCDKKKKKEKVLFSKIRAVCHTQLRVKYVASPRDWLVIAGLFKITLSDFVATAAAVIIAKQRYRNAQRAHDIPNTSITVWLAMQLNPLQVCTADSHQSSPPTHYSL